MKSPIAAAAVLFALLSASSGAPAQTPPAAPDLSARIARAERTIAELTARAQRVADYDEIRNLQMILGYYQDKALWEQVVDLFADDATLEVAQNGVFVGKPAIRRYLLSLTGGKVGLASGQLNNHLTLSPVITLAEDGRHAKGRWRLLLLDGIWGDASGGNWGSGVYENEYVKEDGVWKVAKSALALRFYAPYKGGWTRTTDALTARYGKSKVAPTRASAKAPLWPQRTAATYHYDNPGESTYRLSRGTSVGSQKAPAPANTAMDLEARTRGLELAIDRLQSVNEVENLESTYGYYADKSQQDAISALFTDSASLEILGRGVFLGGDRVYEY
ncbi:hypothetical protein EON77_09230, partial [bacterium]